MTDHQVEWELRDSDKRTFFSERLLYNLTKYPGQVYSLDMRCKVNLEKVQKKLKKLPDYISAKIILWSEDVEEYGIAEVRKISGYHDEPLKGERFGQRSIKLNRGYRLIYIEKIDKTI